MAVSKRQMLNELIPGFINNVTGKPVYTVHWAWYEGSKTPSILKVEPYNSSLSHLAAITHVEAEDEMAAYVTFEKRWHDKSDNTVKIWISEDAKKE